jgi:hypothetical protein
MPEGVTTATHVVTLNSSDFRGILNIIYGFVIIDVHARKELYFIVRVSLSRELKIYHVVSCINRAYCSRYTVISTLCIFLGYVITGRLICSSSVFYQCLTLDSE